MKLLKNYLVSMVVSTVLWGGGVNASSYDASYILKEGMTSELSVVGSSTALYTGDNIAHEFILENGDTNTYEEFDFTAGSSSLEADELLASTSMNSDVKNEVRFINAVLGSETTNVSSYSKVEAGYTVSVGDGEIDPITGSATEMTGLSTMTFAGDFEDGYFLLKFGAKGTDAVDHFLFRNNAPLNTLVWLTEISMKVDGKSILGLSHYATVPCRADDECGRIPNEEIPDVPLPAAVWLFGSALMGLVGFGRKKVA